MEAQVLLKTGEMNTTNLDRIAHRDIDHLHSKRGYTARESGDTNLRSPLKMIM